MKKIFLTILFLFSMNLNANVVKWNSFEIQFYNEVSLPNEIIENNKKLFKLNEKNYYLYCYQDILYLTNTKNKNNIRFVTPLIKKFKENKKSPYYYEYYNCNYDNKSIEFNQNKLLDENNNVMCLNNIAYQHVKSGFYPLFKYYNVGAKKKGIPLNCEDYKEENFYMETLNIDKNNFYCINNFVYSGEASGIIPVHSEVFINHYNEQRKETYNFDYSKKIHPLFCLGGEVVDFLKSDISNRQTSKREYYSYHGKKYKILKINKKKYLIPLIKKIKTEPNYKKKNYLYLKEGF